MSRRSYPRPCRARSPSTPRRGQRPRPAAGEEGTGMRATGSCGWPRRRRPRISASARFPLLKLNSSSGSKHQGVSDLSTGPQHHSPFHPSRCARTNENSSGGLRPPPSPLQCSHISDRRADPFPSLLGKVARSAGWGVARCYDASRLARMLPRTCGPSALLSTPHPSPSATPSPLRGEGGARRPPAGSMTCVNAVGEGEGKPSPAFPLACTRCDHPNRCRMPAANTAPGRCW